MTKINKKAAMFGLDARIALAIFGALSVISGAALYSAIQEAKVVQIKSQVNEIVKAWEQYYLDTGITLPQANPSALNTDGSFYDLHTSELIENSTNTNNWNGPYLANKKSGSVAIKTNSYASYFHLVMITDNDSSWGGGDSSTAWWTTNTSYCLAGRKCSLWVQFSGIEPTLVSTLDEKIDNGDGGANGKIKWHTNSGSIHMYIRTITIKNPND